MRKSCRLAQKTALLVAAAGALLAPGFARADCPAANRYSFSFANQAAATLSYGSSYTYTATSTALGNQNVTVSWQTNGVSSSVVANIQLPAISNLVTDGVATENLVVGGIFNARTADIGAGTNVIVTTITFPVPIRDFTIQLNDVDYASNQFRDWLRVVGTNGGQSYTPEMTTPFTNNNTGGATTDASSTVEFGPRATAPILTAQDVAGNAASGNNSNNGTLTAVFPQPVTQVQLRYGNYPLMSGETTTGQQAFGIQSLSYCPMPQVTVVKSATPYATGATDPLRFDIPGSDVVYSLTVSNSNSSPVDVGSLQLTDLLPATMTFFNGDIDGTGPLTTNFEFVPGSSGMSLTSSNLAYSSNGGSSYAYTPAAGYDASVNGVRFAPQGAMAANSSFTIRFRTRIR